MINRYICPKPSCQSRHLNRVSGTSNPMEYICYSCSDLYIINDDGIPVLKDPIVNEKKSKYNNTRVKVDGISFDSQGEANYYWGLKLRRQAKDIKWFALQPRFILQDGDKKIEYRADFIVAEKDGTVRVVDFKGFETDSFKLKRKLLESQYDLTLEIQKGR